MSDTHAQTSDEVYNHDLNEARSPRIRAAFDAAYQKMMESGGGTTSAKKVWRKLAASTPRMLSTSLGRSHRPSTGMPFG